MKRILLFSACFLFLSFSKEKAAVLYRSLDPKSVSKHLAFYNLFPDTPEGERALQDAWDLLSIHSKEDLSLTHLPKASIQTLVEFITKKEGSQTPSLNTQELLALAKLSTQLPNQKFLGKKAKTEAEILALDTQDIDLAHGLFISQSEEDPALCEKMQAYEALIDLMALQILTQIKLTDPPEIKIRAINRFIFEEMGYRFPPHSVFTKDIDLYTYLPSVIDSRRGVCLGISILYLSLSQRLELPLEAITPPGHIYVRYHTPEKTINIETTARGIHLDSEEYLGIETTELTKRSIKDVIGLAYFNEASAHWQNQDYAKAIKCYEKATKYLPQDILLQELMGYNYLFLGEIEKGTDLIRKVYESNKAFEPTAQQSVIEDFLNGKADIEALRILYSPVDETRESLMKKKESLQQTISKWPEFRAAYFQLASTWLQLHRYGESLQALQAYENYENNDPTAEYLLCQLSIKRSNYPKAWDHLHRAEELLKGRVQLPKTLRELRRLLASVDPE